MDIHERRLPDFDETLGMVRSALTIARFFADQGQNEWDAMEALLEDACAALCNAMHKLEREKKNERL